MKVPLRTSEPKFTIDVNDLVSLYLETGDVWTAGSGSEWSKTNLMDLPTIVGEIQ